MWIKFKKDAAANERMYHEGDTALFEDTLGQTLVEGGFADYYDPGDSLVLVDLPHVPGTVGENVNTEPVKVDKRDGVVTDKKKKVVVETDPPKPVTDGPSKG